MGHVPVMRQEVLDYLGHIRDGIIVDGTLGQGGHSEALLEETPDTVVVVGIDRDLTAVEAASARLKKFGNRFIGVHSSYSNLEQWENRLENRPVRGFLVDLGLSSVQLDCSDRGFSFKDEHLDMRFDESEITPTAADIVNTWPVEDLANLIYRYGEERASRRIARAIVRRRESERFSSARDLSEVVSASYPSHHLKIHPATRTFQALRIAVNRELETIEAGLGVAERILVDGGILLTISFHSLEDRIVKLFLRSRSGRCTCPPGLPICSCNPVKIFESLTRKPEIPRDEETSNNPRARSAKLRCAVRKRNKGETL